MTNEAENLYQIEQQSAAEAIRPVEGPAPSELSPEIASALAAIVEASQRQAAAAEALLELQKKQGEEMKTTLELRVQEFFGMMNQLALAASRHAQANTRY